MGDKALAADLTKAWIESKGLPAFSDAETAGAFVATFFGIVLKEISKPGPKTEMPTGKSFR